MRRLSCIRPHHHAAPSLHLLLAVRWASSADATSAITTAQALDCLEAPCGCSNKELKKCFQARTLIVHPDQGGSSVAMMRLTDAYKQLTEVPPSQRMRDDPSMLSENDPLNDVVGRAMAQGVSFGGSGGNSRRAGSSDVEGDTLGSSTMRHFHKRFRPPPRSATTPFWELHPDDVYKGEPPGGSSSSSSTSGGGGGGFQSFAAHYARTASKRGKAGGGEKSSAQAAAEFVMNHTQALDEALRSKSFAVDRQAASRSTGQVAAMAGLFTFLLAFGTVVMILEVEKQRRAHRI